MLSESPSQTRREGVVQGRLRRHEGDGAARPDPAGAGSELQHAIAAAEHARRRDARRQRAVLLPLRSPARGLPGRGAAARAAAAASPSRRRSRRRGHATSASTASSSASIASAFGAGAAVMKELGITAEHLIEAAKSLTSRDRDRLPGRRRRPGRGHPAPGRLAPCQGRAARTFQPPSSGPIRQARCDNPSRRRIDGSAGLSHPRRPSTKQRGRRTRRVRIEGRFSVCPWESDLP